MLNHHNHSKPQSYLFDHFDGLYPWHGYWATRFADANFPANDLNNTFHSRPLRIANGWEMNPAGDPFKASKLVFPRYTWLSSPSVQLAEHLILKVKPRPLPFTWAIALKWASIIPHPTTPGNEWYIQDFYFGTVTGNGNGQKYLYGVNSNGLGGNQTFANNTYAVGDDVLFTFKVEADRTCQYDLKVNGVTAARFVQHTDWPPNTNKTAPIGWVTNRETFFPDYIPIRFGPVYGGQLEYLEFRLFDHTL